LAILFLNCPRETGPLKPFFASQWPIQRNSLSNHKSSPGACFTLVILRYCLIPDLGPWSGFALLLIRRNTSPFRATVSELASLYGRYSSHGTCASRLRSMRSDFRTA
jgi:hypothetical protein